jgi:hypothetical protein
MMVMRAPLTGIQYDRDNERVYLLIKQWILDGPAWSFITPELDRSKDGRAAWLALRARYEGEAYMNRQREEALATLDKIHYKGERATFNYDMFTSILTKAYNDLERYGEGVRERRKVRDLLNKIQDPKLEGAKQAVRINPQYQEDFAAAVNFIAESVEPLSRQNSRNIATTNTNSNQNQNNQNQGTQGQGRGRGCRNHQGRGYNYRGGYQGRNTPYDQQRGGRYGPYRGGRNNYQGRGSRFGGRHYNQHNPSSDNSYFSRS